MKKIDMRTKEGLLEATQNLYLKFLNKEAQEKDVIRLFQADRKYQFINFCLDEGAFDIFIDDGCFNMGDVCDAVDQVIKEMKE